MSWRLHDTIFGQAVRLVSGKRYFRYPDEIDPTSWRNAIQNQVLTGENPTASGNEPGDKYDLNSPNTESKKTYSDDTLLIGWYGDDDPENPQNWPSAMKHFVIFQMCFLNYGVYIASSIYTPGEAYLMQEFGVSQEVAVLGLSLFTFGYGVGPMLWSPLSEMPKVGRAGIYFWTLLLFVLFQLAVGFAPNVAVFLVFRWITGFCGSPCLSNGGNTVADIYTPLQVPYVVVIWSSAGLLGPIFGPVIGGFVAPAMGWRWTIWVFTWFCSLILIVMFFFSPETGASKILYERAKRLRKQTGKKQLKSQAEIDSQNHTTMDQIRFLGRAFVLTFREPIIFLMNLYAGLLYGLLFLWFESFPFVFGDVYHFSPQQQGLVFIGILVFACFAVPGYLLWIRHGLIPKILSGNFKTEMVLPPMFVGSVVLPVCMFWFGWTGRVGVHWIVPIIGSGAFSIAIVTLFNSLFTYLALTYTPYAGSVFAGATLFRACFGASFPLFANALFRRLGVGPGNSLLGGLAILFIPIPFLFYTYGARFRASSKYALA